ncbi:metal-dependent hydrolase family protein [Pusillimonas noertemannii]|uniref:Imidazolonepropionase-like amidohydrolase n=1 Tax=Pusillimonas noertemannii TaxID=305977 RepID=A0A2U1CLF3_9BURK|nr:amidohydrolase family protein [Pusillimonas noertemannii]NYT69359.1 amidohydrolase family protein [Pusillimonas noertemannii]PVY61825.1 imidazolonepropionase-like amidohydrolase [Pusillimonas noertemannii]TFL09756.1 amidohydrolase family protein [Pusillimonas noertemannii]
MLTRSLKLFARSVFVLALGHLGSSALAHDAPALTDEQLAEHMPASEPAAPQQPSAVLFTNVRIFDGKTPSLSGQRNVLVRKNHIEKISADPIDEPGAAVIDGQGRVLMPGLIDAHWHTMFVGPPVAALLHGDSNYISLIAGREAERALMRGFTTVRDMGGSAFGLKQAIDEHIVKGPRIYPAGAMITVTSGHGDFRNMHDLPRQLGAPGSHGDEEGHSAIADSPDEVRLRTREQLFRGAALIKLTAGGGVSSPHSPLDAITFTPAEIRAAVEAATNWGTYVAVHAYTSQAVEQAIEAGVKVIEHGSLMDEATAQLMAQKDIWLSPQAFPKEMGNAFPPGSHEREKFMEVFEGADRTFKLAKKYKLKTVFGTDVLFSSALAQRQGAILASMTEWYTPPELLVMATSTNAELLKLSGKRNPYPGDLGVVSEGAFADLLLVDGDPLTDIQLVATPERSFVVIMKDGVIYKNTLEGSGSGSGESAGASN